MLFSAGFGVSLVFWSVAEPMSHFFLRHSPIWKRRQRKQQGSQWAIPFFTGASASGPSLRLPV
nr:BCCT family transporter [Lentibacillus salicampi]